MAKEEMLEFEGVVEEVLPDARCRVKLDNGLQAHGRAAEARAHASPSRGARSAAGSRRVAVMRDVRHRPFELPRCRKAAPPV